MNERMITIPFEEYEELQNFKSMAQKENMLVYIKNERFDLGHGSRVWFVYTKDEAVRKITKELIEARKELEDMKEDQGLKEESESDFPYRRMFWLLVGLMSLYVAVQIIEPIFK